MGGWAALDILQIQRIERLRSNFSWVKYVDPRSKLHIGDEDKWKRSRLFVISLSEFDWSLKRAWHPWATFFSTEAICSFHAKLESIMLPKLVLTCSNGRLLQLLFRVIGGLWVLNKIVFVLDRFNVCLFFCNQLNTLLNSILVFFSKLVGSLSEIQYVMLCHQRKHYKKVGRQGRGPKFEPCGTPHVICISSDWNSIRINELLSTV